MNSLLYGRRDLFVSDDGTPPRWRVMSQPGMRPRTKAGVQLVPETPRSYTGHAPRAWQSEALAAWTSHERRGVVEAVTGTGKTTVGVLAAASAVDAGEKVLVLVPGRELLDQWYEVLQRNLPSIRIGRLGDGNEDALARHEVVVATVQSASRWQVLQPDTPGLLIADEVHRYGAETFARALEPEFVARLGLTATYARDDEGLARHLDPYFGGVVYTCGYERGLADGVLARFRVGLLGVDFDSQERELYGEYNATARTLRGRLIATHGCPPEPFGSFMAAVVMLSEGGLGAFRPTKDARAYLNAFSKRRQLLAECRRKHEALAELAPVLAAADRGLVFSETKDNADAAALLLSQRGVAAMSFTSSLRPSERRERMDQFKQGEVRVLAAPRVLDEGIDVPQADVGVILAASRSKRQMIQRMGRVIRPKVDGRPATFIVMYVRGTAEDPAMGAHEAFLSQLVEVAEETTHFPRRATGADLLAWHLQGRA
ncbi:DEAD/DEAH box helicase [Blastococcus aggregatus]|nr:DEAD/DEAH box helicase [Blastococcus aggregatus]